ncbi:MAG: hypothetical protein ABL895_13860, partial [Cyclobacteriaceae bacterium]
RDRHSNQSKPISHFWNAELFSPTGTQDLCYAIQTTFTFRMRFFTSVLPKPDPRLVDLLEFFDAKMRKR